MVIILLPRTDHTISDAGYVPEQSSVSIAQSTFAIEIFCGVSLLKIGANPSKMFLSFSRLINQ